MRFLSPRSAAAALIALGGLALVPAAHATSDTVTMENVNGTTGVDVTFTNGQGGMESFNNVAAGDYHISLNGGATQTAFCTDLYNEIYLGESWNVNSIQTSAANGLVTGPYPYAVPIDDVNAIDYIGQNYATATTSNANSAAAQLAIWGLVVGDNVTYTNGNYGWANSNFSESGVSLSSIYAIDQLALAASGPQGSQWLEVVDGSQNPSWLGRPQDLLICTPQSPNGTPAPVPEPSSLAPFAFAALGLGGLMLKAKKRQTA
jgi:hypothetical protein